MHRLHLRRAAVADGAPFRSRSRAGSGRPTLVTAALVATALLVGACAGSSAEADRADRQVDGSGELPADLAAAADDRAGDPVDDRSELGDPADAGYAPVDEPTDDVAGPAPTDGAEPEQVDGPAPDEVISEIADQLADAGPHDEILDAVETLDQADGVPREQDGRSRNSSGEPVTLDEAAGLACANAEIALGLIDDGEPGVALERIATAAGHAAQSDRAAIREWSQPLSAVRATDAGSDDEAASSAPLVGFLSVCTERGYEL